VVIEVPLRRVALVEQAIAALQARIEGGDWEIGERLPPEQQLATQLGVGRSTVREAVRALASMGLVQSRHGAGTYVQARETPETNLTHRLARAEILDVYEVRQGLEMQAAPLAARRRTEQDLARMHDALRRRRRARRLGRMQAWVDADVDFHQSVIDAAHNPVLSDVYRTFLGALRDSIETFSTDADETRDGHEDHVALATAIANGDAEAAITATIRILATTIVQTDALTPSEREPHVRAEQR
jgi:DNA-binding FadR family transcriptional regulator